MDNQRFEDIIREIQESRKRAQQAEELMKNYTAEVEEVPQEPTREVQLFEEPAEADAESFYSESYEAPELQPAEEFVPEEEPLFYEEYDDGNEPYYEPPQQPEGVPTFEEYCEQQGINMDPSAAPEPYDEDGYAVNEDQASYAELQYVAYDDEGYAVNGEAQYAEYPVQYDAEGYPVDADTAVVSAYEAEAAYDADGYSVENPEYQYEETALAVPEEGGAYLTEELVPAEEYPVEYDANGYPIVYDADGNPLENDIYGYPIQYDANGYLIHYDAEGYPLENDEFGNPIVYGEDAVYYGVGPAVQDVVAYEEITGAEVYPAEDTFETDGLELDEEPWQEPEFYDNRPEKKGFFAGFFSNKRNIIIAALVGVAVVVGIVLAIILGGGSKADEPVVPEVNGDNMAEQAPELPDTVVLQAGGDAGQNYLANTLFLGDSNTVRLSFLGLLPEDNTAAIVGVGINDIGTTNGVYFEELSSPTTILKAVEMMQPGRIIMNFGTNDQKLTAEDFIKGYKKAIEDIKAVCPDADIIVSAIFPVTKGNQYSMSLTIVDEFNEALLAMCEELEIPFLDVTEVLKNLSSGEIKADYVASDGIHLTMSGLKAYLSYARTHALTDGIERAANSGDYTRKETPYVPLEDDKEDPIDQSEMLRQLGQFLSNAKYKAAASDAKLDDTTKWAVSKAEYIVAKEQNREGNEDTIAEAVFEKVKTLGISKPEDCVYRISCIEGTGGDEGKLFITVQLAKVVEHKCDDDANFEEDTTKAVKATCTTDGKKVGKCKLCGKDVNVPVKAEGHKYEEANLVVNFKPSCNVEGKGTNTCTVTGCGFVNDKVVIPALVHDFEHADCEIVAEVPATCTAKGAKSVKCHNDGCLVTKEVEIPMKEHEYTTAGEITQAPTCDAPGKRKYSCACGAITEKEEPAAGHSTTETINTAATCGTDGSKTIACSKCSYSTTEPIPATGAHTYSGGTCTGCGAAQPTP